jgi:hypothetical protein
MGDYYIATEIWFKYLNAPIISGEEGWKYSIRASMSSPINVQDVQSTLKQGKDSPRNSRCYQGLE